VLPGGKAGNGPTVGRPAAGMFVGMFSQANESFLNGATLMWAAGTVIAVGLLAASMNRRRTSLVDALRGFVKRNQPADAADSDGASRDDPTNKDNSPA